jgi:hypothetical protein
MYNRSCCRVEQGVRLKVDDTTSRFATNTEANSPPGTMLTPTGSFGMLIVAVLTATSSSSVVAQRRLANCG